MKTAPFVIEEVLNAPVSRVWKAITNKDDRSYRHLSSGKA